MNIKKILSIILTIVLTMGMGTVTFANAENLETMPEIKEDYTPIYTADDLNNIRNNLSGKYIMMNDIDLSTVEWVPIGTESEAFKGELDGNSKTINGLNITETVVSVNRNSSGIFAFTNGATIKNLNVSNAKVKMSKAENDFYSVGIIAGVVKFSTVENCKVYGKAEVSVNGTLNIGGVIGEAFNTVGISKCENNAEIIADAKNEINVGGVVGSSDSKISLSSNKANITVNNSNSDEPKLDAIYIGGICGNMFLNEIKNCYNTGDIQLNILSDSAKSGGIAGTSMYISSCYNIGNIEYNNQEPAYYTGGIVGLAKDNDLDEVKLSSCYCIDNTLKAIGNEDFNNKHNVKILSESEMKNQSSYVGFDFENAWEMEDSGYPVFRSNPINSDPDNPTIPEINGIDKAEIIYVPLKNRIVFSFGSPNLPNGIIIKMIYSDGTTVTERIKITDDGCFAGDERITGGFRPAVVEYGILTDTLLLKDGKIKLEYKYLVIPPIFTIIKGLISGII